MILKLFLAAIAGIALTFSFSPFNYYWLSFISVGVIAYLWMQSRPWQAFWTGLFYGMGFFGSSTYWIYISVHYFGNTPIFISLLVCALFVAFISFLFFGLLGLFTGYMLNLGARGKTTPLHPSPQGDRGVKNSTTFLFLFPACWVLGEFWRTYILTGFPWALLGYSQMHTPLRHLAPIIGVYGISFLVAITSAIFITLLNKKSEFCSKIISLILLLIIFGSSFTLQSVRWTTPIGKPLNITLVQGNISQNHKWDMDYLIHILQVYKNLTDSNWRSDLIIWPEAAVPTFPEELPGFVDFLTQKTKANHSHLLFGIPLQNLDNHHYYNGIILVGGQQQIYKKEHLVPFGEYMPLKFLFSWFYHYFQIPMSDSEAGPKNQAPLQMGEIKIAPFICYEIIYPWRVLRDTIGRQLIVSISDDSWFGDSIALKQQEQMTQMRAVETGRFVVMAANTGITAVVNPQGDVIAIAPKDHEFVLKSTISAMSGKTPLMFWQYYPILALALGICILRGIFHVAKTNSNFSNRRSHEGHS